MASFSKGSLWEREAHGIILITRVLEFLEHQGPFNKNDPCRYIDEEKLVRGEGLQWERALYKEKLGKGPGAGGGGRQNGTASAKAGEDGI